MFCFRGMGMILKDKRTRASCVKELSEALVRSSLSFIPIPLKQNILFLSIPHACPLGRSSEKKLPADFLFWFHLHMTPRLWEDVLELQKQAKLKDNVIFSAQGAPKKSWGTYFHVKSKKKLGPLSSLFLISAFFGLKNAFFFILHLKWQKGPK